MKVAYKCSLADVLQAVAELLGDSATSQHLDIVAGKQRELTKARYRIAWHSTCILCSIAVWVHAGRMKRKKDEPLTGRACTACVLSLQLFKSTEAEIGLGSRQAFREHYAAQQLLFQSMIRARNPSTARSLDDPIRLMSAIFALREVGIPVPLSEQVVIASMPLTAGVYVAQAEHAAFAHGSVPDQLLMRIFLSVVFIQLWVWI